MIFFKTATFALFSTEMFLIKNTVNETNVPFLLIKLTATLKIFFFKLFPQSKKTNKILTLANETCVYYKMHHKTKTKIIFKVVSKCSLISHVFLGHSVYMNMLSFTAVPVVILLMGLLLNPLYHQCALDQVHLVITLR